ncbi:MAG: IMP dehydrogenase [Planctomycetes bacterium]|nr:IMP dehydrogenase [Planctomycetota bacterium]
MHPKIIGEGFTYDDVLVVPAYSEIVPGEACTQTRFSRNVHLRIPLSSAAMDTVTEADLAIALAQEGGIGIIHKNLRIEAQTREVDQVKRSANGIILDPVTLPPDATVKQAAEIMKTYNISGVPIVEATGALDGILTSRDLRFHPSPETPVCEVMTHEHLVTAPPDTTLEEAREILRHNKVEKLLLVDGAGKLRGLITIKDIDKMERYPDASRDGRGRLRVGAAIGVGDYERADALIAAGVDVLVVDTAHGHSHNVLETVVHLKRDREIDVVAGNVATADGAQALVDAGVDGVKVGIGPGAICTTRVVAGVGVPQLSAVLACADVAAGRDVPVIADGGVRHSGDIVKALVAGASCVMLGSLFAGLAESPGETVLYQGRRYKSFRGMGSLGAMVRGSKERYGQRDVGETRKLVPEGVEGIVPHKGPLSDFVYQLVGGVRAGMGYVGAQTIAGLQERGRFLHVSTATLKESHPHEVTITQESPNYRME